MSGTIMAAFIPVIFSPIIARLYAPEFYGNLGLYMSVSGLLGVLAYSHYSQAVMVVKEKEEAKHIIWFSLVLSTVIALLVGVVMLILITSTSLLGNNSWFLLIPFSIFFNGITAVLNVWANRVKAYTNLAINRVVQAVITVVIQISFGLYFKDEKGLMIGFIFGQFLSAFLLFWKFFIKKSEHNIGYPVVSVFKEVGIQNKKWLLYVTPTEFINNFINQTPILLLQKMAGPVYVGNFVFAQRLLGLPQQYISNGIVDIFKQKASEAYHLTGSCKPIFLKTFKTLGLLAIIPAIITFFWAPAIFSWVFGSKWAEAGVFCQYLTILFFFRFIVSPLSYVYFIAGKLKEDFFLHILFLILTTAAFYVTNILTDNKHMLILAYSLAYSSIYMIYLYRSYHFSTNSCKVDSVNV